MIVNIKCLIEACNQLNIKYSQFKEAENLIQVTKNSVNYFFINCTVPLNRQDVAKICIDKDFTIKVLNNVVRMPKTLSFFDPNAGKEFQCYVKEKTIDEMVKKIVQTFGTNVVVKMNSGSRKRNVYFPTNVDEIRCAIGSIFNKNSKNYDFVALAQEKIDIKKEFRVITLDRKIELIYTKWRFEKIVDLDSIRKVQEFINPVFDVLDLKYAGFDIALNKKNEFFLIEINTAPRFALYAKKNGNIDIIELQKKVLAKI